MGRTLALLAELAYDLTREWLSERKRRKAQEQWAQTPAPVRGCARCKAIAYTPGQTACHQCGSML
jgi:hypothetical protein